MVRAATHCMSKPPKQNLISVCCGTIRIDLRARQDAGKDAHVRPSSPLVARCFKRPVIGRGAGPAQSIAHKSDNATETATMRDMRAFAWFCEHALGMVKVLLV